MDIARGPQDLVAAAWIRSLVEAGPQFPVAELYRGRAFSLARRAAGIMGADLAVVSAGLGVVMEQTMIPSYDLTLARGGVQERVSDRFDLGKWWSSISRGPYASDLAAELQDRPFVLVCLSHAYVPLIVDALDRLSADKLRIFGAGIQSSIPVALAACVLPYDQRLDVVDSGTRSDFAQRAMLHYVTKIYNGSPMLQDDRKAVVASFKTTPAPAPTPKRRPVDDSEVRALIARLLPTVGPRRSVMLRYLRDKEGLACEQGRFARLFNEVARG